MTKHHAGMIVRQKALDWWPYLGQVIDRINKAADTMDIEAIDETFLDVASLVSKRREITTVAELKDTTLFCLPLILPTLWQEDAKYQR